MGASACARDRIRLNAAANPPLSLTPDQVEVPRIYQEARCLADDEDGIQAVEGIGEQRQAAGDGEEP